MVFSWATAVTGARASAARAARARARNANLSILVSSVWRRRRTHTPRREASHGGALDFLVLRGSAQPFRSQPFRQLFCTCSGSAATEKTGVEISKRASRHESSACRQLNGLHLVLAYIHFSVVW